MKKIIYTLLLFVALPLMWSCDKDEEEKEEKEPTQIPEGWVVNEDLTKLAEYKWYIARSEDDSIKIEFYKYNTIGNGGLRYWFYKKSKNGGHYSYEYGYLLDAYSVEQNGEKVLFGQGYGLKDYSVRYEMINDSTITIYNLPEVKPFENGMVFKALKEKRFKEKNLLLGGWYDSQVVDSTVIVCTENNFKEYLFIRGSSTIQDFWDYGDFSATRTESYANDEFLSEIGMLKFEIFSDDNCSYQVDDDNLTIYWKSPRKTTTYKRINK